MSTASAGYSGKRGAWGDAVRELKAQLAESAPRAVRAKGLVSLRSSLDAAERGDLDSELSGVLAGAVRLSKASTSNTDDNKIIRAALAAATTAARVAPPTLPSQEHTGVSETIEGAAVALTASKGWGGAPLWHRCEAARATLAVTASRFDAVRASTPVEGLMAAAEAASRPPQAAVDAVRDFAAAAASAGSSACAAADKAVAAGRANRSLRIASGAGASLYSLPGLCAAAADMARCGAAGSAWVALASSQSLGAATVGTAAASSGAAATTAASAYKLSCSLGANAASVIAATLVGGLGGAQAPAARSAASIALRATRHASLAHQHGLPASVRLCHAAAACSLAVTLSDAVGAALMETSVGDRWALPLAAERSTAAGLVQAAAGLDPTTASTSAAASAARKAADVTNSSAVLEASSGSAGIASRTAAEVAAADAAAVAAASGTPLSARAAGGSGETAAPVTQAELLLPAAALATSRDAAPAAAELLGAGGAWGAGSARAAATAVGAVPAELAAESLRASGVVDPLLLRAATAAVGRALASRSAAEALATASLLPQRTEALCACVTAADERKGLGRCADMLRGCGVPELCRLGSDAAATALSLRRAGAGFAKAALVAALSVDKEALAAEKEAAAGTDGSVRGAARLEAARAAAAAAAPLLEDRLPPTAVLRVVAAAASALACVRPSAIAAQSDARRGKRTSLVALSGWAGAAMRERSPRSLSLAVMLLRCVADVAAGIATGDAPGASGHEARVPSAGSDGSDSDADAAGRKSADGTGDADTDGASQASVRALMVREGVIAAPAAATIDSDPRPAEILLPLLQALSEGLRPCDDTSSGLPIAPIRGSPESAATAMQGGGAPQAVEAVLVGPLAVAAAAVTPLPSLDAPHAAWLIDALQGACDLPGVPARRLLDGACEALKRRGGPPAALAMGLLDATEGLL